MGVRDLGQSARPRERLLSLGAQGLSDVQLLALLLGTGGVSRSALDLAQEMIASYGSLERLARVSARELMNRRDVGPAKAGRLVAAFELARRMQEEPLLERVTISSSDQLARLMMGRLGHLDREHFEVVLLDVKSRVIGREVVSIGHLSGAPVHPREVFKPALQASAAAVVLIHNHPSGDPTPSRDDIAVTERLVQAGKILGIEVLDHLIIGAKQYVSLRQQGLL
ncbi:MAG: RadC family protein [Bacteroidota bacterium]